MFKSKSFQHIAVVSPSLACWGHKDSENYHMSPICLWNSPKFIEQNPNSWTKSSLFQWTPHFQFLTIFVCPCHHQPASASRFAQANAQPDALRRPLRERPCPGAWLRATQRRTSHRMAPHLRLGNPQPSGVTRWREMGEKRDLRNQYYLITRWWCQPLWNILVSWDDEIPNIWINK